MAHLKLTPDQRRARLLGHAVGIAKAKGFAQVTCVNVAKKDDATGPLVNKYFGTRDGLRWAVIEEAGRTKDAQIIASALDFGYSADDLKGVASQNLLRDAAKLRAAA